MEYEKAWKEYARKIYVDVKPPINL